MRSSIKPNGPSTFFFFFFLYFFLQTHSQHAEIHAPGVELEPELGPVLQPQQHGIQTILVTYATACGNTGSLTHGKRPVIKFTSSQRQQVLNPLSHNGNSQVTFKIGALVVQWKCIQLVSMRMQVPSLASLRGLRIRRCHELCCVGCRDGSDPRVLWLWCKPEAVPLI